MRTVGIPAPNWMYDRLARTTFWAAVFVVGVLLVHSLWLAGLMYRQGRGGGGGACARACAAPQLPLAPHSFIPTPPPHTPTPPPPQARAHPQRHVVPPR